MKQAKAIFTSGFPIEADSQILIFAGGIDDGYVQEYMSGNIENLRRRLSVLDKNAYRIIYFPEIAERLHERGSIHYNYPQIPSEEINRFSKDFSAISYSYLWRFLHNYYDDPRYSGFLRFSHHNGNLRVYDFFQFCSETEEEFADELDAFCNILISEGLQDADEPNRDDDEQTFETSDCLYSTTTWGPMPEADDNFDIESKIIIDEIRERIEKLRLRKVDDVVIRSIFNPAPKLSRLVVTDDFRITLPEFNDMEICLEPLIKSVYLLFLSHPEGILFKNLPDYEDELTTIYKTITNRSDISSIEDSIQRILNPYNNAINEKCSKIRSAFVEKMSDRIARNYYITGDRGCPKYVSIAASGPAFSILNSSREQPRNGKNDEL